MLTEVIFNVYGIIAIVCAITSYIIMIAACRGNGNQKTLQVSCLILAILAISFAVISVYHIVQYLDTHVQFV